LNCTAGTEAGTHLEATANQVSAVSDGRGHSPGGYCQPGECSEWRQRALTWRLLPTRWVQWVTAADTHLEATANQVSAVSDSSGHSPGGYCQPGECSEWQQRAQWL